MSKFPALDVAARTGALAVPEPPIEMPPGRTVHVRGRGEFFVRDTGGEGPAVLLLHGWLVNADLNWCGAYGALVQVGYRVLAIDHRGHGRGLRPLLPFRLADCAADAAGVLRTLGLTPSSVVGYSMGGAIAQLMARDHPEVISGMVLSGTAQHFQGRRERRSWRVMGPLELAVALAPTQMWQVAFPRLGLGAAADDATAWLRSELLRNSPRDMAEAGRELGRFDSRPWLAHVRTPAAVVLTARDVAVPPSRQRQLAQALNAPVFEVPINHLQVTTSWQDYNPVLLAALHSLQVGDEAAPASPRASAVR
jgi:3-oxoadipate enol-lactonase